MMHGQKSIYGFVRLCIAYHVLAQALLLYVTRLLPRPSNINRGEVWPGAHKRKERVTSILYRSNQEVKSSASGCGVTRLDDYHIRLVCCSQVWPDGYDLEPI